MRPVCFIYLPHPSTPEYVPPNALAFYPYKAFECHDAELPSVGGRCGDDHSRPLLQKLTSVPFCCHLSSRILMRPYAWGHPSDMRNCRPAYKSIPNFAPVDRYPSYQPNASYHRSFSARFECAGRVGVCCLSFIWHKPSSSSELSPFSRSFRFLSFGSSEGFQATTRPCMARLLDFWCQHHRPEPQMQLLQCPDGLPQSHRWVRTSRCNEVQRDRRREEGRVVLQPRYLSSARPQWVLLIALP